VTYAVLLIRCNSKATKSDFGLKVLNTFFTSDDLVSDEKIHRVG
jgi:hypothetical protein